MQKTAVIFGGAGFLGREVTSQMLAIGWKIKIATRSVDAAKAKFANVKSSSLEFIECDILNAPSIERAMYGCDAAINCVGILAEKGANQFDDLQATAAGEIGRMAQKHNVSRLIHISSIGADIESKSLYSSSKGRGEQLIQDAFAQSVILRPSIIFGEEDSFFNRFAQMTKTSPMLPLVGAQTKFQPVYVKDVALAVVKAVSAHSIFGIYELGGPEVANFRQLMNKMLETMNKKRIVIGLPFAVGGIMASSFDILEKVSFGAFHNEMLTHDQIVNLRNDNIVAETAQSFVDLEIQPRSMDEILPLYLSSALPCK